MVVSPMVVNLDLPFDTETSVIKNDRSLNKPKPQNQ
jgi:hypothetical protein